MLRAAPWELGRTRQKLPLLAKPLCLTLRQPISTSVFRKNAARAAPGPPGGDHGSNEQPTSRFTEPASSIANNDRVQYNLPKHEARGTDMPRRCPPKIERRRTERKPAWQRMPVHNYGRPMTHRQSLVRNITRRVGKIRSWDSFYEYIHQKALEQQNIGTSADGPKPLLDEQEPNGSILPKTSADNFATQFGAPRAGDEENDSILPSNSGDKFAAQFGARRTSDEENDSIPPSKSAGKLAVPSEARRTVDEECHQSGIKDANKVKDLSTETPKDVGEEEDVGVQVAEDEPQEDPPNNASGVPTPEAIIKDLGTGLTRSWRGHGPSWLIHSCVSGHPDQHEWRLEMAKMRTTRPSIIALQLLIRRDALRLRKTDKRRSILQHLPQGERRRTIINKMAHLGLSRQALCSAGEVMEAPADEERCRRFLAPGGYRPLWLLNFLLRPGSTIHRPQTLSDLVEYCMTTYDGLQRQPAPTSNAVGPHGQKRDPKDIFPEDFAHLVLLLAMRAMVVDARLLPKIAQLAAQYIQNMGSSDRHPEEIFFDQCGLFNAALGAFRPSKQRLPVIWYRWIPSHWEAQKILLNTSTSLPRQLLVDKLGYRSVREVLSGLDKDQKETHSSVRHRQTWPPYLEPGDGIDEASDPDANWSRSVSAGTLQQESGYSLDQKDEVLNILQGRSSDGTPTIQQRIIDPPHPDMQPWEASIKATRNAQEAWYAFRRPPTPGTKPGPREYGALMTKLLTPAAPVDTMERPGDSTLNFPHKADPNLTEFERKRIRHPTVNALRGEMLRRGVRPTAATLNALIASRLTRASLRRVKGMLKLSGLSEDRYLPMLSAKDAGFKGLQMVPLSLFVAFIKHISDLRPVSPQLLMRAMRMCDARFAHDEEAQPWAQHCWGLLLNACARRPSDPRSLATSLVPQINMYHYLVDAVAQKGNLKLPIVMKFANCAQKAARRILASHAQDIDNEFHAATSPLKSLYGHENKRVAFEQKSAGHDPESVTMLRALFHMTERVKGLVQSLIDREQSIQSVLGAITPESVDWMRARGDPVQAAQAHNLMWTWAFLGEYEEMARYLGWLVEQWDSYAMRRELEAGSYLPSYANFTITLCIFRRYAEPMLPEDRVEELRCKIDKAEVLWQWPTADKVDDMLSGRRKHYTRLIHVQHWLRYWQAKERKEDMSTIMRPGRWDEREDQRGAWFDPDSRTAKRAGESVWLRI